MKCHPFILNHIKQAFWIFKARNQNLLHRFCFLSQSSRREKRVCVFSTFSALFEAAQLKGIWAPHPMYLFSATPRTFLLQHFSDASPLLLAPFHCWGGSRSGKLTCRKPSPCSCPFISCTPCMDSLLEMRLYFLNSPLMCLFNWIRPPSPQLH